MERPEPEFEVGEYVRIWSGPYESFGTTIYDLFWHDGGQWSKPEWWYKTTYGDQSEGNLVKASDRRGWHYDHDGYCDNPARGY